MPRSLSQLLIVALLTQVHGLPAFAAGKCPAPGWMRTVKVRSVKDDIVGTGKGDSVDIARREARREIGHELARRHGRDLLKSSALRGRVNRKAFSDKEVQTALAKSLALYVRTPATLEHGVVCSTFYIAVMASRREILQAASASPNLADEVNAALAGRIDKLDEEFAKTSGSADQPAETAGSEATIARLNTLAEQAGDGTVMGEYLKATALQRAATIKKLVDDARTLAFKEDRQKASASAQAAAADAGKFLHGSKAFLGRSYLESFEVFHAQATSGDPHAQFLTGAMYFLALGVKRDHREALKWLRKSAAQGVGQAHLLVGAVHLSGTAGKQDLDEAFKWFRAARDDGWTCDFEPRSCTKR